MDTRGIGIISHPDNYGLIIATGNVTLGQSNARSNTIAIDPGGAGRDVTLWDAAATPGAFIQIVNMADAAETLTVKNAAGSTIKTIAQNRARVFVSLGGSWVNLYVVTIDIS